jgi:predicted RNase H-like HicB family nuclease
MVTVPSGSAAMRFYSFEIVIGQEPEDAGYGAYSPSLPVCFSNRRTVEEAGAQHAGGLEQHVAAMLAHGDARSAGPAAAAGASRAD